MNKAAQSDGFATSDLASQMDMREQLSALADGQLGEGEIADALAYAAQAEGQVTWQLYHLVGDVLRSTDLARPCGPDFMVRLREELAKEALVPAQIEPPPRIAAVAPAMEEAANASVFRWKMVAGFASLAAVAAIGWTSLASLQAPGAAGGAQLALVPAPAQSTSPAAGAVVAVADAEGGSQVMLRDPRLDELLAAHKQFGSTTALQMPAGFLRNATFESPGR